MGKSTKRLLEAKENGNKELVQKMQQKMDKSRDMEGYNKLAKEVYKDIERQIKSENYPETEQMLKSEDIVEYIKENYPETEEMFQKELNNMYMTFCKKQYDYGPGNIAMGTLLKSDTEIKQSLFGIIVRMNDKINRLLNLSTKHNFKAQNEPIEDAFLDIAIYCLMALIVKSGKWSK